MTIHIIDTGDRSTLNTPRRARALTPIERVRDFFFDPLPVRRAATSLWATNIARMPAMSDIDRAELRDGATA